jgi:hypothetical protein
VLFVRDIMGASPTRQQLKGLRAVAKPGARATIDAEMNTHCRERFGWGFRELLTTRFGNT